MVFLHYCNQLSFTSVIHVTLEYVSESVQLKSKLEIIDTYYHHLLVDVIDMQLENVQLNLTTVDIQSRLV